METENTSVLPLRITYLLVCILLLLPVVMLPVTAWLSNNPMLADYILQPWLINLSILLMVSVTFDTMLYKVKNSYQAINAALWVIIFAIFTVPALGENGNPSLFALLFFLHAMRSGFRLFKQGNSDDGWWLWLAWVRDVSVACIILFSISLW